MIQAGGACVRHMLAGTALLLAALALAACVSGGTPAALPAPAVDGPAFIFFFTDP